MTKGLRNHSFPLPPKWVLVPLLWIGVLVLVKLVTITPFLSDLHKAHPMGFVNGILLVSFGIWGMVLYRRRNSTPEFAKSVLIHIAVSVYMIWMVLT